jgi:hypothetical protein
VTHTPVEFSSQNMGRKRPRAKAQNSLNHGLLPFPIVAAGAVLALVLSGCAYDVSVNALGVTDTTGTDGGGTVQRATLTVTARVSGPDSALAVLVGSPSGVLRAAAVTIQRQGSAGSVVSDTTDAVGQAAFPALLPGSYVVSVVRLLAPAEIAQLDSADRDVNAFGGGAVVTVAAPATDAPVAVAAGRRGALVISEMFSPRPYETTVQYNEYDYGQFIELYNNADTTIYLDGKIIGRGISWYRDFPPPGNSCVDMERWRNDPDGIWMRYLDAFPGTGRQYPLAPGQAVVVATDAIDHRTILPDFLDLSGADFEFEGPTDVDNPAVPNMVDLSLGVFGGGYFTHGLWFDEGAYVLADAVDVAALPHDNLPVVSPEYLRMPAASLLDVFTTGKIPAGEAEAAASGWPLCPQIVNTRFDRQYANLYDRQVLRSMRRRVFGRLPDGRVILMRTRSSANDFELAAPTPGVVP